MVQVLNLNLALNLNLTLQDNNRGYANLKIGRLELAEADIKASLEIDKDNALAIRNLGLLHLEKADTSEACKNFRLALKYFYTREYGEDVKEMLNWFCR